MYNGLSLDQAPPISVVMRFFITVPFFGILLGAFLFFYPDTVLIPNHPVSLASIHLMFLGVITMAMLGALFQMQSVLGGRPIPAPAGNAFLIHLFLVLGIIALTLAFTLLYPPLFIVAAVFLGSSILYGVKLILPLLFNGTAHDTLQGMKVALTALSLTALLGIVMATEYANETFGSMHEILRTIHYSLGLIGWIAVLIIAVAFQVVEMFYVTPSYSPWCKRNAFNIIAGALGFKVIWFVAGLPFVWVFDAIIGALLMGFIATTLKRLLKRKRRVSDVSIWFWLLGMGLLFLSLGLYGTYVASGSELFHTMALIAYALFALSIILGMMGKIIPFLVWFHLNSAGYMDTPIMSNIITYSRAKALFVLFTLTVFFTLFGVIYNDLLRLGAMMGIAMFGLLLYNIIIALKMYRYTLHHGMRFEQM